MNSVQSLPRGRLKRLLENNSDRSSDKASVEINNESVGNVIKKHCDEPSLDDETRQEKRSASEDCVQTEQGYSSDSGASSVEDHLVDPSTLNLDESFFSPTYQSQPMADGYAVVGTAEKEVHDCDLSTADSTASEDGDKMYQIFSQLTDFEKQVNEANACYESWEKRARELREPRMPSMDTFDVPLMLSQAEDFMHHNSEVIKEDPEWQSCDVPHDALKSSNDNENIEIFVSNVSHKAGRIVDVAQSLKRIEQEKRKKQYLEVHKVHLLLLLAHGMQVNRLVNVSVTDLASELYDLVANSNISVHEKDSLSLVRSIVHYYRENVKLSTKRSGKRAVKIKKGIQKQIVAREASCRKMLNVMLLTVLRYFGVRSRLVMHLDVVPKSPPISKPPSKGKLNEVNRPSARERYRNVPLTTMEILKRKPEIQHMFQLTQLDGADEDTQGEELAPKKGRIESSTNKPRLWKLKSEAIPDVRNQRKREEQNNAEPLAHNLMESGQRTVRLVSSKYFRKKPPSKQRLAEGKMACKMETSERTNVAIEKPNLSKLIMHKVATIPNDSSKRKHRLPELDVWIECFLEPEKRWTVVEAAIGDIDCMEQVIDLIQDPPVYVFAFEPDSTVVDVSERYRWRNESLALKQRVDKKWLKKALKSHRPPKGDLGFLLEQLEFRQLKCRAPMPTTIAQFKNHPSYCLPRDLQKFQGIYPPDAPPLGYIHGEPVYARECVHTLHSREVWLRHAKVIRMLEQPYKIVKSKLRREQTNLELFGYWQTEDYIPPEPIDGIVPRNAYGNIEIFKDCMLPKGTVHLKQYGLSNICRKLEIDYAVAVVGFGIHAGGNHPVFDGIVICEEHRDRLLEAWEIHQEESAQKKLEKKRQMVLNNWVKLVKGLLVRRKLKNKYNFDGM